MNRFFVFGVGACVTLTAGGWRSSEAAQQDAPPLEQPAVVAPAQPATDLPPTTELQPAREAPEQLAAADPDVNRPVKPLTEGPLHEAFLSPAKDRDPVHVDKAPPPPIVERPGVDPPDPKAQWIEGYWEWDQARKDFTWVTGTWRVSPPGRFFVNGYWKRDDQGWYR
ncbi:MAG: hypothetical protein LC745_05225, partial [Planctomycetia bacterium]|nr:hypothetical protein [Planctomycetia bacterium]